MTEYVEHGGLATAPGPLQCLDATLNSFWLPADHGALARLCDRVFDTPSNGAVRCTPVLPVVLLVFARLGRVVPEHPCYALIGHVPEREAVVFVPVVVRTRIGPRRVPGPRRRIPGRFADIAHVRFAALVTSIFLDNAISIASGREIYGYPKNAGWPMFPEAQREGEAEWGEARSTPGPALTAEQFALDAFAFETFSPASTPQRRRLLTLTPEPSGTERPIADTDDLARWVRRHVGAAPGLPRELLGSVLGRLGRWPDLTVEQLFLRQLRAVGGGTGADFQQAVAAPATVMRWHGPATVLPRHTLAINELASHRIRSELGIDDCRTILAGRARCDFRVGPGRSLWAAAPRA